MTYCVAININEGLVFASDSRTNAGVDHVSVYSKMHNFTWPGNRVFVLLSAGNLATTQSVVKRLKTDGQNGEANFLSMPSMTAAHSHTVTATGRADPARCFVPAERERVLPGELFRLSVPLLCTVRNGSPNHRRYGRRQGSRVWPSIAPSLPGTGPAASVTPD
ncbi:hypothetical protein [uncultured Arthrobacter sp.]|uniref:hypothetical protein n=1 Tax=uncultured Arthrobacter sp. TaxID=114050 RepID=UPI00321715C5